MPSEKLPQRLTHWEFMVLTYEHGEGFTVPQYVSAPNETAAVVHAKKLGWQFHSYKQVSEVPVSKKVVTRPIEPEPKIPQEKAHNSEPPKWAIGVGAFGLAVILVMFIRFSFAEAPQNYPIFSGDAHSAPVALIPDPVIPGTNVAPGGSYYIDGVRGRVEVNKAGGESWNGQANGNGNEKTIYQPSYMRGGKPVSGSFHAAGHASSSSK